MSLVVTLHLDRDPTQRRKEIKPKLLMDKTSSLSVCLLVTLLPGCLCQSHILAVKCENPLLQLTPNIYATGLLSAFIYSLIFTSSLVNKAKPTLCQFIISCFHCTCSGGDANDFFYCSRMCKQRVQTQAASSVFHYTIEETPHGYLDLISKKSSHNLLS